MYRFNVSCCQNKVDVTKLLLRDALEKLKIQ